MNTVILDKTQPEIAEVLKDCKVGDTKTGKFTMNVTSVSDQQVVANITDLEVEYEGEAEEVDDESLVEEAVSAKKLKKSSAAPESGPMYPV